MSALGGMFDVHPAFLPVDMSGGANTGDWFNASRYHSVGIMLTKALGTAGQDPTITVSQATDNAGTGSKALNLPTKASSFVWKKQAATDLTATAAWANASADVTNNTLTNGTLAEEAAIVFIEIPCDLLDADGGFDYIQASVADVGGAAQLGVVHYFGFEPRYQTRPDLVASPL